MDARTRQLGSASFIRPAFLWALLPALVLSPVAPAVGNADVATNITSTTGAGDLGTTITHTGNLYDITGGTRPGDGTGPILFHSFGDFSVGQSAGQADIANFHNDSGLMTTYVIGRVTGGNPSSIDGIIQTTGFDVGGLPTNLFLVNPSGIVFGPHGSFNVGGSVSFSTAQYLRLFDGVNNGNFYDSPASDGLTNSVLAVAPAVDFGFLSPVAPAAYGFLTAPDPNASITVQGSALSVLSAPADTPPNSISLVGGKVVIEGGAHLSAPSGMILLATSASPGEFDVNTLQALQNLDGASFTSFGSVSLALGSSIDVSGASTVFVKGGQLVLSVNDATLNTSESTALQDTISLSPGSSIVASTSGADPGADVQLIAGTLQTDSTLVETLNSGDRKGGDISINATTVGLTNGTFIQSSTGLDFNTGTLVGSGNGGNVTVQGLGGGRQPCRFVRALQFRHLDANCWIRKRGRSAA